MGNGEVLRPGEFQRMSAGTGIRHSEFNPSDSEPVHLYQIWLLPLRQGIHPSYEQRPFAEEEKRGKLRIVASPNGADGSLTIHQDARIYLAALSPQQSVEYAIAAGRHAWLQVLRGRVSLNGQSLEVSDGAAISREPRITMTGEDPAEVMLFDLA